MAGFFTSLFNKITNRAEIAWDDLEADLIGKYVEQFVRLRRAR